MKVIQNCRKDHNCVGAKMLPSVINLGACLSNLLLNLKQKIIILLNYIKSFVYLHFFCHKIYILHHHQESNLYVTLQQILVYRRLSFQINNFSE